MKTQQHTSFALVAFRSIFAGRARRFIAHCTMASIAITPVVANTTYAAIADVPLYLTNPVQPNIMFVLDDSGSMHWEGMPDNITYFSYLYPRPSGLYGGSDYANKIPDFGAANIYNMLMRSPYNNKVYYNPAVTYSPWVQQNGVSWGDASITCAPYNPQLPGLGCLDLTVNKTTDLSGSDYWYGSGGWYQGNHTFYPATYYRYNAGSIWSTASYSEVKVVATTATYTGDGRASRTDCTAGTCTYAQEIKNFANWFTYYRSRILAARAGIGKAFASQGTEMRVGFGAINKAAATIDGVAGTRTVVSGVRPFSGTDRTAFFTSLYGHTIPTSGTPLRRALDDAGQYFSRTDNLGPWGATPGTNDATAHLECRQSYTILMTDGYWNTGADPATTAAARANVDGTGGPTITGSGGNTFTYAAVSPFTDENSDTLADVAMYYWKNDLRTDLANAVPTSTINPAFWQHMVTFGVGLGVTGSVNPTDAFNAITSSATINWTNPTSSDAAKLDDLLHAAVNSRGGFFSASDPNTFATKLAAVLDSIEDRTSSSSAVASNSTRLSSSTHLYQALFKSGDWSGQLKAFPLLADDVNTVADEGGTIGPEVWDAADGIPAHGSRNIKTWNGSIGTNFLNALGGLSANQVNYLRGDDTLEISNSTGPTDTLHVFRNRSGKLGDIINSAPHYVKNENFGYNTLPGAEGTSYSTFLSGKSSRTAVIYAGANDGMLHGFDAATGQEKLAYVPNAVWPNLPLLTDPAYTHKYFVDGSPTAWDAYWNSSWKTVLVGSLGAGGKAVYALDVSNPDTFGDSNVLWEFTHADMGYVMGNVTVARFADNNYWAVFGNGYASTSGKAVLFMVQMGTSPLTVKMIEVDNAGNGLSTPTLVDSDGDRIIDMIYAGDLKGNVWRVNVTGNENTWKTAYGTVNSPKPLFTAKDGSGNAQPITSPPEVGLAPSGASGLMVYFGTGKYFETGDQSTTSVQSMYGIVDSGSAFGTGNNRDQLVLQSIIYEGTAFGNAVRAMSDNEVTYPSDKGWFIDLLTPPSSTAKGERVIAVPRLFGGRLLFQSIIPSLSPCDYGGTSWLMQVNPATGGRPPSASFDINGDGLFNNDQINIGGDVWVDVSGVDFGIGISGGFGSPISAGGTAYVPLSGTGDGENGDGEGGALETPEILGSSLKSRASWRQIQ